MVAEATSEVKDKLFELAHKLFKKETMFTKEQMISIIMKNTGRDLDRATNGFNMMLQVGAIEQAHKDGFYLGGSTPF